MKNKVTVAFLVGVMIFGVMGVYSSSAEADDVKLAGISSTSASTEALNQAVELNNQIKDEIAKIRKERKLRQQKEAKNLEDFISFSLTHRFMNYDIRTKTNLTAEQLELILKGTGLEGLGSAYVKAEETYSVSSIALIGISSVESSWGSSNMARAKNNLFGYKAYDSNVGAATKFRTKEDSIMTVAQALDENYLQPYGAYFRGVTLMDVNNSYASDKDWYKKITYSMNLMIDKLK